MDYLVGPLSRYKIIESYGNDQISSYFEFFEKPWKKNILFTNFLRLIEMYLEVFKSLKYLEDPIFKKQIPLPQITDIKNQDCKAAIEAPRGTLIHHYRINKKKKIEKAKLFMPTEINLPRINKMISDYAQKLYEKKDLLYVKKMVKMMIRAFDPCISCATH